MAKKTKKITATHPAVTDRFNIPVAPQMLNSDFAGPDPSKFRTVWNGWYQTGSLTPERVAQALRSADAGMEMMYLQIAEEIEEKDGHYAAILGVRKRAVVQLPISVEAAGEDEQSQQDAEFIREWLKSGVLKSALFDMLDAVAKSFSVHEIEWDTTPDRVWPRKFIYRLPRWFGVSREDGETVMLRESGFNLIELPEWKFVIHKTRFKSGPLIRGGLARVAVWAWMFKAFTMKDWAIFVQNYGQPLRLGRYDPGTVEHDKQVLWEAVRDIAGDTAAIVPKGMEIEFIGMKDSAASAQIYIERCKYLDQTLSKIVLGQTTTVDAISGGHAVSQEHDKVRQDIEKSDAEELSAMLTRHLVPMIIKFNFGPRDAYPVLKIGRPDEMPMADIANALDKMGPQGLEVPAAEIRRRLGMPDPQPGEQTIGGRVAAPQQPQSQQPDANGNLQPPKKGLFASVTTADRKEPFEMVEAMAARVAQDASGAMGGMIDNVREALNGATDLHDAAERIAKLDLDRDQLIEVMARGMALAHLAGQASVLDEIKSK